MKNPILTALIATSFLVASGYGHSVFAQGSVYGGGSNYGSGKDKSAKPDRKLKKKKDKEEKVDPASDEAGKKKKR